ncbi:TonB-dependent receptor [Solimonas terrae]|uniref:TonB-dependent receptor n=1 Tax=Solimonas terrae TaxID=1396819 RepID=A0A6M2BKL1_9GAMM|nr:TonB-dependent receptor [Solimonas terrae]NGY03286.1 TonB-dependent receptor [Solimonas terrae]
MAVPASANAAQESQGDTAASPAPLPTIPVPSSAPETPPETADSGDASAGPITEIIVTATKRARSVRDVPVSINAIAGDTLEKTGARDIQDYIATVPGITMQDGSNGDAGGRKITVRGVGPSEVNGVSGNQTVGQFIGDIPMTDPYSNFVTPDLDPFDLQTVEILKGPQGTYFGASALNGAIRYVPNKPQLDQWELHGFSEALSITDGGMNGTYAAAANLPIGDSLAVRATGVLQNTPGYIDNLQRDQKDADSRRKWSGRGALRWQPTDRLDVNLMYLKQHSKKDDVLDVDNSNGELTNNEHPGPSSIETGFDLASIDARYDTGAAGTVVLQSSLQHKDALSDLDSTLFTGSAGLQNLRAYSKTKVKGTTHELRLVSPDDGNWSWIVGAFYQNYHADVSTDAYFLGTALPLPPLPILDQILGPRGLSYGTVQIAPEARETSLYGELTRTLFDDWELTAGARFYKTRISGTAVAGGLVGTIVPDAEIDQHDKGISPKISLSYKPSRSFMVYATLARGFQFGGINTNVSGLPFDNPLTGPPVPPSFKSSSLWNREIGIRTDWLHRSLQADVVFYDLDWNNAQFVEKNDNLVIDTTYVSNVGKVRSRGVESSLIYATPLDGLILNLAAGYSSALTATPYTAEDGSEVPSGTVMPNSPHWQLAGTVSYEHPFGSWLVGGSIADTYTSRAYDTILHDHTIFDYSALNLGLSLARPDLAGSPALSFDVTNVLDRRGVVGRGTFTGVSGLTGGPETPSYIFIRPRTFALRLSFDFQ